MDKNVIGFPKIIHQIYGFWDKTIPDHIQKRIDTWKNKHPDYTYILWDKKTCRELIKNKFNWFLSIYDRYKWTIQKADAIRYFILYEYGGVYCDIDLEPARSITPLLDKYKNKMAILYCSPNSGLLTNDFMVSKKGNPFWKKVWYEMVRTHNTDYFSKHLTVMYSTGPLMLDSIYEKQGNKKKYVYIINAKYINNCDISSPKPARNKEAYLKRYEGNAWHSIDSTILNVIYKYFKILFLLFLILFVLYKFV